MSERAAETAELIDALSADDADRALIAWTTLAHGWAALPSSGQRSALIAALQSPQDWTASAARRFMTDGWDGLKPTVQTAALETVTALLEREERASTVWMFLTDHFGRLPAVFETVLTRERFEGTTFHSDVAADRWDFLTAHWVQLSARIKSFIEEETIAAALDSAEWRVASAGWDFLNEHWERLDPQLQKALSRERFAAAAQDPVACLAAREFLDEHAASLPPELGAGGA